MAAEGVTGDWCCCCVGSLNSARGDALNGDSGFEDCVDVDVVVDRVARKSVVDDGVCSNGRARALRRTERANMVKCCTCRPCVWVISIGVLEKAPDVEVGLQNAVRKVEAAAGTWRNSRARKWPRGWP